MFFFRLSEQCRNPVSIFFIFQSSLSWLDSTFWVTQSRAEKSTDWECWISCLQEEETMTSGHRGSWTVWVCAGLSLSLEIGLQPKRFLQTRQSDVELMVLIKRKEVVILVNYSQHKNSQIFPRTQLFLPRINVFVLFCSSLSSYSWIRQFNSWKRIFAVCEGEIMLSNTV